MALFAFIHSPLIGPYTWKNTAQVLESKHRVIYPSLTDNKGDTRPFWIQHSMSAASAINALNISDKCVLIGHSGAGPLLPLISTYLRRPASAYIFVDAGLPQPMSRLEMIRGESPGRADELERFLKSGGLYPRWSDADLQSVIPNEILRQQLLKELNPRGLAYFTEELPVPDEWDNVPCAYIQLSEGYALPAKQAKAYDWPTLELKGGHFQMLVAPGPMASALTQMVGVLLTSF